MLALALAALATVAASLPEQIHIALAGADAAGNPNGMTLSWATPTSTATSTALYGLSETSLNMTVTGYAKSYFPPYEHHHVVLTDLTPSTQYYYKVGDATDGFGPVLTFTTAPASQKEFTIAVFGDFGYGDLGNAVETRSRLDAEFNEYDWILHVGDISYADDYQDHPQYNGTFQYENVYNGYQGWLQNITSAKPYMVMPGNHEADCNSPLCVSNATYRSALSNFSAYNTRFRMPAPESHATGLNMWYSFNYASVHFIALDTETDYPNAPELTSYAGIPCGGFGPFIQWLEADLAAVDRKAFPWVIAAGHRPIYYPGDSSPTGDPIGYCKNLQDAVEGLFGKYGVDLYFSGHQHSYQRTWPVLNNVVQKSYTDPKYPVHLIVGGAGCDEMANKTATATTPAWLASKNDEAYGMGLLKINATVAQFKWLESKTGDVIDSVTIVKAKA